MVGRFVSIKANVCVMDLLRVGDPEDPSDARGVQIAIGTLRHGELFTFLAGCSVSLPALTRLTSTRPMLCGQV